ncbi:MAG: hypothetical protein KGI83_06960 [Verrucomicrobiota bacterium]|nr:hypothetical protein [Verrucomicrobiota bacterium]
MCSVVLLPCGYTDGLALYHSANTLPLPTFTTTRLLRPKSHFIHSHAVQWM